LNKRIRGPARPLYRWARDGGGGGAGKDEPIALRISGLANAQALSFKRTWWGGNVTRDNVALANTHRLVFGMELLEEEAFEQRAGER
jgi:hypothetical protein